MLNRLRPAGTVTAAVLTACLAGGAAFAPAFASAPVGSTVHISSTAQTATPARSSSPASSSPDEFKSPSKNIYCSIWRGHGYFGARCDIGEHTWTAPPKPRSCHFDWGFSLKLHVRSHWGCVSDAVTGSRHVPTLEYGETTSLGRLSCTSRRTGMVCTNVDSGHGFKLSRAKVRRF